MVRLNLSKSIGKRIRAERRNAPKGYKGAFKFPHPIRKPPRMKGKVQNKGIKKRMK